MVIGIGLNLNNKLPYGCVNQIFGTNIDKFDLCQQIVIEFYYMYSRLEKDFERMINEYKKYWN